MGNFLEGVAGEVVHVGDEGIEAVFFFESFHQTADLNDLFQVCRGGEALGVLERCGDFTEATGGGEAVAGEVDEDAAHGDGYDGVEMLAVIDAPAAAIEVAQPEFVDQFGRRDGSEIAFVGELADGELVEGGPDLSEEGVGDGAVAGGVALEEFS